MLVAHYCSCSDELPVQLAVPKVLQDANRQQLTSYSLLGQEFWMSVASQGQQVAFKTATTPKDSPPPVPPKQDARETAVKEIEVNGKADFSPMIDPKKSSTVPVAVVTGHVQSPPKPPPRTAPSILTPAAPPSVPPRTSKPCKTSVTSARISNAVLVTTTVAVNLAPPPNEMTLIDIMSSNDNPRSSGMFNGYVGDLLSVSPTSSLAERSICSEDLVPPGGRAEPLTASVLTQADDKLSDYEDIWSQQASLLALQPTSVIHVNGVKDAATEAALAPTAAPSRRRRASMATQTEPTATSPAASVRELAAASPFYNEPVDAVRAGCAMRLAQERFGGSDPYMTFRRDRAAGKSQRSGSLESLLDHIRQLDNDMDYCQQILNKQDPSLYSDVSTQFGGPSRRRPRRASPTPSVASAATSHLGAARRSRAGRESSWPVDSSWEWQSSDEQLDELSQAKPKRRPLKKDPAHAHLRQHKKRPTVDQGTESAADSDLEPVAPIVLSQGETSDYEGVISQQAPLLAQQATSIIHLNGIKDAATETTAALTASIATQTELTSPSVSVRELAAGSPESIDAVRAACPTLLAQDRFGHNHSYKSSRRDRAVSKSQRSALHIFRQCFHPSVDHEYE